MTDRIHTSPTNGDPHVGRTLPSLVYDGATRYANPRLMNRPEADGWKSYSAREFCRLAEEMALGLLDLGLNRGDTVGMFMNSDVNFCVADMGCLIAGLVDVPIYLTHEPESVGYVLEHSQSAGLIVSNQEQFESIWPAIRSNEALRFVVVVRSADIGTVAARSGRVKIFSFDEVLDRGRKAREADPNGIQDLLNQISPHDLATIIYTSGTTGRPKGVMLTHENISSNALTSFSELVGYRPGPDGEIGINFLPLTHVFARTLHYGFLAYGTSNHFIHHEELGARLLEIRPTIFATVPRVLEKVYARIRATSAGLSGLKKQIAFWALGVATRFELGARMSAVYRIERAIADRLVFKKWRDRLGGRVHFIICGGAALNADLANIYAAAGIDILQGYGLTETSPVITFNRAQHNRAGTVGHPIPGVEVKLASDGEVLTRGPNVMRGYFRDEQKTREVIDEDGWFHTGDIGHFNEEDCLVITDRKKDLFKLSTGKYVAPQPLENRLTKEAFIDQAFVLGPGRRFCAALIFPNMETVRSYAMRKGIDGADVDLLEHPLIVDRFQRLVDRANREAMEDWSKIKKFRLVAAEISIDSGLLTPTLKLRRPLVREHFKDIIESLYAAADTDWPARAGAA